MLEKMLQDLAVFRGNAASGRLSNSFLPVHHEHCRTLEATTGELSKFIDEVSAIILRETVEEEDVTTVERRVVEISVNCFQGTRRAADMYKDLKERELAAELEEDSD